MSVSDMRVVVGGQTRISLSLIRATGMGLSLPRWLRVVSRIGIVFEHFRDDRTSDQRIRLGLADITCKSIELALHYSIMPVQDIRQRRNRRISRIVPRHWRVFFPQR